MSLDMTYGELVDQLRHDLHLNGDTDLLPRSIGPTAIGVLPAASLRFSSGKTFAAGAAGVWSQLTTFGTVDWSYANMKPSASGIKVPQDGIYLVSSLVVMNIVNGGWEWDTAFTVNGVANQIWNSGRQSPGVGFASFAASRPLRLKIGDTVGVAVFTSDATGGSSALNNLCSLTAAFHSNTPANILAGTVQ